MLKSISIPSSPTKALLKDRFWRWCSTEGYAVRSVGGRRTRPDVPGFAGALALVVRRV